MTPAELFFSDLLVLALNHLFIIVWLTIFIVVGLDIYARFWHKRDKENIDLVSRYVTLERIRKQRYDKKV